MRIILHIDLNAFYASVEQALNCELIGKPIAVAGDPNKRNGIILTASYEARAQGVRSAMTVWQAKQVCPYIIFVLPHYGAYMDFSRRVMNILREYSPLYEQFSIDEAWIDVTGCERIFGDGNTIAWKIKERIKAELNITCSVGVSYCKLMAKMASDLKKPDAVTVVMQEHIKDKIWILPVRDLIGVGRKVEPKLNSLGIYTIGDLAGSPLSLLEKSMGKFGKYLWYFANGMDSSKVNKSAYLENVKGMGNSTTTSRDLVQIDEIRGTLLSLCESVSSRLRESGYEGRVVEVEIRNSDFITIVRQRTLSRYTNLTMDIFTQAEQLLIENWEASSAIRLLGVRVSGLRACNSFKQLSVFRDMEKERDEKVDYCMDKIRNVFGYECIVRASLMVNNTKLSHLDDEKWMPMHSFRK